MKKFFLLILILMTASCATSTDMDDVRRDLVELRAASANHTKEIEAINKKTDTMAKEESLSAIREGQGDINTRLSELTSSTQELRGRFDESKYFMEKSQKDIQLEQDLLRARITGLENQVKSLSEKLAALQVAAAAEKRPAEEQPKTPEAQQNTSGDKAAQEPKKTEEEHPKVEKEGASTDQAYEEAYQAFKEKHFKEAREKFGAFAKANPKSPLADNAQFWIGESYYSEKDYEDAILAYETVLKKYLDSEKTAGALLKQGYSFIEIGDVKTGKIILKKLIEKFPTSKEADLAKKKISEIEKKPGRKK